MLLVLGMLVTAADFWQASFFLVIAGEMIMTLGLAAFSLTALSIKPAAFWKILPIIMAPVYFISWGPIRVTSLPGFLSTPNTGWRWFMEWDGSC